MQEFRERLMAANLDRRVLERTIELAKRTKAFDHRKLPPTLRVAIDSSPLDRHLAVDELDDVGVLGVEDHHLGGAARLAARLDDAGTLLLVGIVQLAPVLLLPLFYSFKPLDRPSLVERLV